MERAFDIHLTPNRLLLKKSQNCEIAIECDVHKIAQKVSQFDVFAMNMFYNIEF